MIKDEYIFLNVDAKDKNQLLTFVSEQAYKFGICEDKEGLLEDLKNRELEFSTGLQDGFAIPHARSPRVKTPSIFFIRANEGMEWGTMDDLPAQNFFCLLVPEKNEGNLHLQMISQLATCLLEDDFKEFIQSSTDKTALKEYILKNMEVN